MALTQPCLHGLLWFPKAKGNLSQNFSYVVFHTRVVWADTFDAAAQLTADWGIRRCIG